MKKDSLPYKGILVLSREFSCPEISRMMKIPRSSLFRYCQEFGIKCVDPGERTEKFILENYKKKSVKTITAELNMHEYYIRNVYKKLGIKPLGYTRYIRKAVLQAKFKRTIIPKKEPVVVAPIVIPKKKGRMYKKISNLISVRQVFNAMNLSNINILDNL